MSGPWLASYIALWAVVLFQGAVIFLLLRQLGVMYLGTAQGVARDGLPVGAKAPDFTVESMEGRSVSLADFRGLPLLLVFGSPNCRPCRQLVPDLNVFASEQREALSVLFLSRGEPEETRRFASEVDIQVPMASHPDESLPEAFKARVTPFAFLLDGEGVVQAKGLANNRSHLDMLLRSAAGERGETSRNGAAADEALATDERGR